MYRGVVTSRSNYDDITENRVSRKRDPNKKVGLIAGLLGVLICVVTFLVYTSMLKTKDLVSTNPAVTYTSSSSSTSSTVETSQTKETVATETSSDTTSVAVASTVAKTEQETETVSMDIDDALPKVLEQSQGTATDYLSASDYNSANESQDNVVNQGVELKKPVIAQNLSVSQQSSFSRDIVKYTDYTIQEGDSLDSIAQKFGLSRETIISVNQIRNTTSLWIGSTLSIPDRDGTMYTVKEGDTLSSIVQQLNLSLGWKALSEVNGLRSDELEPGQKLFIPLESVQETGTLSAQDELNFVLPSSSAVTVGLYNQKVPNPIGNNAIQLDGILLQAEAGTPVCASEAGTVIDRGFNENGSAFVKILHANGYTTTYNYLADVCVNTTDRVSKGSVLGYFADGTTNLLSPTIFFKIEQDGISLDPYSFL